MLFENIGIGNRLLISPKAKGTVAKPFVSQVEEIPAPDKLLIHVPISYGQLVKLPMEAVYSCVFFTDKGIIRFDARIEKCLDEGELHFLDIKITSQGERIQRRNFYRLDCILPLSFSLLEGQADELEQMGHVEFYDGLTKDIGGGGLRFLTNEDLGDKKELQCVLDLEGELVIATGKILQKQHFPKSAYSYQYRVEFVGITDKDRDKIVQFVFKQQNRLIQKTRK